MAGLEERVAFLEGKVDSIGRLERRFDLLEQRMDSRFDAVDRRFEAIDHRFEVLEDKISRQFLWLVGIQITTLIAVVGAVLSRG